MKRIMTEERLEELKNDDNLMKVMLKCYGEALEVMAEIVNPLAVVDEPFVCAALETAACAIKERMDAEPLSIYKILKETPVTGVSMEIKMQ